MEGHVSGALPLDPRRSRAMERNGDNERNGGRGQENGPFPGSNRRWEGVRREI